ncbi:Ger(x)C family spore germination protein [Priestia filamentosa]|uniref:Spore gernimation protein KC n=1 Tax=Priestia filamentosa TaxID=1402861 RepID=A0A1X7EAB9_9BACI|nr:Ger(x)C family spore germination protein [Priestia filamentosa]AKO92643.1 spore gernimation protein KC [Priestia filamentosa]MDT3762723.1 Ger(x)C family spore germination protein [Priestia filamentosa]OXS69259.1 spore gernimation protein KC [Priestia filamentosa]RJS64027.1 Ger(x)C family spore germination protein [Priestia filamentosa]WCM13826.1 Ger(x)C family spore germination protein [Priestia filamentosa]
MKRKGAFLLLIMMVTVLLTSCWSKKELTDLAIVAAMGVDKTKDGRYNLTLQIINPGNVAGGLQGGGGQVQSPPVTIYSASGDNIVETSRRASSRISRRLYYAHTNLVIVGESLAREEGIEVLMDAFDRDPEFRTTSALVIANHSTAADLVKTLTPVDKIPANKVLKTLEFTERQWGENVKVSLQDVMKGLQSSKEETVVAGFSMVGNPKQAQRLDNLQESAPEATLRASGIAVLKQGKLVDWLYGKTARGTVWILDKIQGTAINVDWEGKKAAIAYKTVRQKTDVSAKMKNGHPHVSIHTRVEGDIGEMKIPIDITNTKVITKIEQSLRKEIKKELEKAIEHAQKNKTDILGFGEVIHRSRPNEWKKIKTEWSDVYFPKLDVDITVDAYIRRTGLRNKSFLSGVKENQE